MLRVCSDNQKRYGGIIMKRYCIRSREGKLEYFDIMSETDSEYKIRRTQLVEGTARTIEETMSRQLFDMCFKTGYIFEMETAEAIVA